jgi:hypothetical protein
MSRPAKVQFNPYQMQTENTGDISVSVDEQEVYHGEIHACGQ